MFNLEYYPVINPLHVAKEVVIMEYTVTGIYILLLITKLWLNY